MNSISRLVFVTETECVYHEVLVEMCVCLQGTSETRFVALLLGL
jgi:hypothetical protein